MHKQRTIILRKEFNSMDTEWRISAVIHDGNWYDFDKWKRVSKVTEEELEDWIDSNEDILIHSGLGSYRVSHDEIVRWYEEENIDLEESIIPNNFPPKLWDKTTETDAFLGAPRRRVGTVSFIAEDGIILEKCINILRGTAKVMPDKAGRYKAHGLSAIHIRNLLSKGLSDSEFNSLEVKTRAILMQRELIDLPTTWLEEALKFYAGTFAPNALKTSMSTISIYLPDRGDISSQTTLWVISALKKFDENASVPFSGYLSSVLRHWPYDLPDEYLGKELSNFQRERSKAIDLAQKTINEHEGDSVDIKVIAELMDLSMSKYVELSNEHDTWLAEKNATSLTWEDSSNEKRGVMVGAEVSTIPEDREKMSQVSLATVKAAVDTGQWDSAYIVIANIDKSDIDIDIGSKLDPEYLKSFGEHLDDILSSDD